MDRMAPAQSSPKSAVLLHAKRLLTKREARMARIDPVGRHLPFKLGKKPARPGAVKFKLANYLVKLKLPTPPQVFGHEGLIGANWGMLGNDHYGDCVWAGADALA